ncbi:winged helix-turn-helix domain-containing protein [Parabacteroides chinchillae]|nr:winged helix-turn-helix domain-containing protein [Parabacteroides chinchillae]
MNSEEKKYVLSQLYLLDRNPIRVSSLDSLLCNELSQNNIPAKIAIVYEAKGEKYCSAVDTSFYKSAWKLKEVVIGFQRDIVLQVYAKLPVSYIIAQSLPVYTLVLLILVLSVVGGILFLRGNKKIAVLLAPKVQRDGILLRSDVLYDKENGVLVYADQEITLTNYKLELFNLLLENNGQYVASDILQSAVWPDGLSTKDALMQTVKRLRMDLKEIPFLKVENLRGNGYRLFIEPV